MVVFKKFGILKSLSGLSSSVVQGYFYISYCTYSTSQLSSLHFYITF